MTTLGQNSTELVPTPRYPTINYSSRVPVGLQANRSWGGERPLMRGLSPPIAGKLGGRESDL